MIATTSSCRVFLGGLRGGGRREDFEAEAPFFFPLEDPIPSRGKLVVGSGVNHVSGHRAGKLARFRARSFLQRLRSASRRNGSPEFTAGSEEELRDLPDENAALQNLPGAKPWTWWPGTMGLREESPSGEDGVRAKKKRSRAWLLACRGQGGGPGGGAPTGENHRESGLVSEQLADGPGVKRFSRLRSDRAARPSGPDRRRRSGR